jgi:hypothetical protein
MFLSLMNRADDGDAMMMRISIVERLTYEEEWPLLRHQEGKVIRG